MPPAVAALLAGALFGIGLAISGMTQPRVVQAFLDVTGDFDPRLGFVMAGALAVTIPGFLAIRRWAATRTRPLLASEFVWPRASDVDARLIAGAALFGVGWGLAGYCPGPVLAALGAGVSEAIYFVPAMLFGAWAARRMN
jgi:hypothetical protein